MTTPPADPDVEGGDRRLAIGLVIGGLIGLVAAGVLLVERIHLAEDPTYVPSCSINPILSCGNVMQTPQAALFGFANPIIGVAAFPVVIATGMGLLAGARFARWYWAGLQVGVTLGLTFIGWLAFQSLYRIGALCPYCMVVWVVVIPTFWYVTRRNLREGVLGEGAANGGLRRFLDGWSAPLLFGVYAVLVLLILQRFWSYWSTLL